MKNIILYGAPGSGKGTQCSLIANTFNVHHISTGEIFRKEMHENTPLGIEAKKYIGFGELVPDELTIQMLSGHMSLHKDVKGFLYDGFPRTLAQAHAFDEMMHDLGQSIDILICLDVNDEEVIKRILNRYKTSGRQEDSSEDSILKRLHIYKNETMPVLDHYENKIHVKHIDGLMDVEDVHLAITEELNPIFTESHI